MEIARYDGTNPGTDPGTDLTSLAKPKEDVSGLQLPLDGYILPWNHTTTDEHFQDTIKASLSILLGSLPGEVSRIYPIKFWHETASVKGKTEGYLEAAAARMYSERQKSAAEGISFDFEQITEVDALPNGKVLLQTKESASLLQFDQKVNIVELNLPKTNRMHFSNGYLICQKGDETKVFDLSGDRATEVRSNWGNPPNIKLAEVLPGNRIVYNFFDEQRPFNRGLVLWNASKGEEETRNDAAFKFSGLHCTPDGKYLVCPYEIPTTKKKNIAIFETDSLKLICRVLLPSDYSDYGRINKLVCLPEGDKHKILFHRGNSLFYCDLDQGTQGRVFSPHHLVKVESNREITGPLQAGDIYFFTYLPTGELLTAGEEKIREETFCLGTDLLFTRERGITSIRVTLFNPPQEIHPLDPLNWKTGK